MDQIINKMDSINYEYHKFAGYLLFPLRLIVVIMIQCLSPIIIYSLDKLGYSSLSETCLLHMNKFLIKVVGFDIEIDGQELITDKPCLFVSNHINCFDSYIITDCIKKIPSFVGNVKFNVFPLSFFYNYFKVIGVEKGKRNNTVEKIKKRVQEGGQLIIYPDSNDYIPEDKVIAPFKSGAFVSKCPIQPIVIRYVSSSNKNMDWTQKSYNNNIFTLAWSYLIDGDMKVYIKVLPLQEYKDSYKSYEEYRDNIYNIMSDELIQLPAQESKIHFMGNPSSKITMKYLCYLLGISLICNLVGNYVFATCGLINFIVGYFCHFYPTKNTIAVDIISVIYSISTVYFLSIQGSYDYYLRWIFYLCFWIVFLYWIYKGRSLGEKKHLEYLWIPGYLFGSYCLIVSTYALYR